jgi:hypothetical protein
MDGLKNMAKSVADGLNEETGKTCIITDNNVVLCVSKNKMKELVGKEISAELFTSLCERKYLSVFTILSASRKKRSPITGCFM